MHVRYKHSGTCLEKHKFIENAYNMFKIPGFHIIRENWSPQNNDLCTEVFTSVQV